MIEKISGFSGQYRFLSNFYKVDIQYDGKLFRSSEHLYMYQKTDSQKWKNLILSSNEPSTAKALGRKAPLIPDWDEKHRLPAMLLALKQKFAIPEMRVKLQETGSAYLEETNHWGDKFWGVCDEEGKNMLGVLLMYIRDKQ